MGNNYVEKVIDVAVDYVGYLEKINNKDLEHKTRNAGKNNYTIFADKYKDLTGANYQAQPWCAMFVNIIFVQAYGKDNALRLLGGFSAYTPTSANYFKSMKQFHTSKPKIGDVIFFKNSVRINHTGIVIDVDDNRVYTVEGNTSSGSAVIPNGGGVFKKSYLLNNTRIAGYGRPAYDISNDIGKKKEISKLIVGKPSKEWIKKLQTAFNGLGARLKIDGIYGNKTRASLVNVKKGDKGAIVKVIQERLNELNFNCGNIDGDFGTKTYTSVSNFRNAVTGRSDNSGNVGVQTWLAFLGEYKTK